MSDYIHKEVFQALERGGEYPTKPVGGFVAQIVPSHKFYKY
jgi:hypothetical protein